MGHINFKIIKKLCFLSQARMVRDKQWLLPNLYMHFIQFIKVSTKQVLNKTFTLLQRSRVIQLYKGKMQENLRFLEIAVCHFKNFVIKIHYLMQHHERSMLQLRKRNK